MSKNFPFRVVTFVEKVLGSASKKNLQSALVLSVLTLPTESEEKSRIIEYFLPF